VTYPFDSSNLIVFIHKHGMLQRLRGFVGRAVRSGGPAVHARAGTRAREDLHGGQLSGICAAIGLSLSAIGNRADLADSILNQANLAGNGGLLEDSRNQAGTDIFTAM
jgi:hypothetical protein